MLCLVLIVGMLAADDNVLVEIDLENVHDSIRRHFGDRIDAARKEGNLVAATVQHASVTIRGEHGRHKYHSNELVVSETFKDVVYLTMTSEPLKAADAMMMLSDTCRIAGFEKPDFRDWLAMAKPKQKPFRGNFSNEACFISLELRSTLDDDASWTTVITISRKRK